MNNGVRKVAGAVYAKELLRTSIVFYRVMILGASRGTPFILDL